MRRLQKRLRKKRQKWKWRIMSAQRRVPRAPVFMHTERKGMLAQPRVKRTRPIWRRWKWKPMSAQRRVPRAPVSMHTVRKDILVQPSVKKPKPIWRKWKWKTMYVPMLAKAVNTSIRMERKGTLALKVAKRKCDDLGVGFSNSLFFGRLNKACCYVQNS